MKYSWLWIMILAVGVMIAFYFLGRVSYKPEIDVKDWFVQKEEGWLKQKEEPCYYTTEGCEGTPSEAKL